MAASWSADAEPPTTPLAMGASPAAIHAALDEQDQLRFHAALDRAVGMLRSELDLAPLFTVLEEFRRLAILHTDDGAYRRVVRAAAALATGQESPVDELFADTRAKAGL